MTAPPILLFDVMDTLVYDPFYREVPAFFDLTFPELLAAAQPGTWVEFERGERDEASLRRDYFRGERRCDVDGLKATMKGAYRWLDGMETLLADLQGAGLELHAFSNYPSWHVLIEEKLGLSRYLAWDLVSWQTGVRKPDPGAYLEAARRVGVEPTRCLLVDDRQVNCAAAEAVGMPAIPFEGAMELRPALAARGLPGL